jgi:hypothetical protein
LLLGHLRRAGRVRAIGRSVVAVLEMSNQPPPCAAVSCVKVVSQRLSASRSRRA